jgi:hypothetical protein
MTKAAAAPFAGLAAGLLALSACHPGNAPQYDPKATDSATQPTFSKVATAPVVQGGIKGCPEYPFVTTDVRERKSPLPVPPALSGVLASDLDHYAVTSLGGGTVCVDTRSMDRTSNLALSADKRFVSWDWDGMEAFGHVVVDRAGPGVSVDTGTAPVASPSGGRLAAVDWSESAFGALNAFAVWEKAPGSLREIGRVDSPPEGFTEWKVEGWQGESCVTLSALSFEQSAEGTRGKAARTRFVAHPKGASWVVAPAGKDSCGAA